MANKHQKDILSNYCKNLKKKFQFFTCKLKMRGGGGKEGKSERKEEERRGEVHQWLKRCGSYTMSEFKLKLSFWQIIEQILYSP